MKITLDLPGKLVQRLKLRAVRDGCKLKDFAADILRAGLATGPTPERPAQIVKDKRTGIPVIQCRRAPRRGEMTPERIADYLAVQETEWARNSG